MYVGKITPWNLCNYTALEAILIIIKLLICRSDYYVTQLIHNRLHEGCLTMCKNIKKSSHSLLERFSSYFDKWEHIMGKKNLHRILCTPAITGRKISLLFYRVDFKNYFFFLYTIHHFFHCWTWTSSESINVDVKRLFNLYFGLK